jgi:hypothetical protein
MNQLEVFLSEVLLPFSYKKKGKKWYHKANDKIVKVIEITTDRYTHMNPGEIGMVKFGINLVGLQSYLSIPSKARDCAFYGDHSMLIDGGKSLNFKWAITENKGVAFWIEDFKIEFVSLALPTFEKVSSLAYLKQNFPDNWDHSIMYTQLFRNKEIVDYLNTIDNQANV